MAPVWDFTKGLTVAAAAIVLPTLALKNGDLPQGSTHVGVGLGLGIGSGAIAAWVGAKNPKNSAAVAENARRKRQRDAFNAGVRARNAARLAKTILIVRPLTGGTGG
jgi:hypothetical protein